jgi:hypothetical protein
MRMDSRYSIVRDKFIVADDLTRENDMSDKVRNPVLCALAVAGRVEYPIPQFNLRPILSSERTAVPCGELACVIAIR